MSTLDKRTGSGDHRSSLKLDYSKIFGGFSDEVTAVPYEKLVAEKAKISSSNKVAMNIKESVKDSEHSSEASDQSIDGENQVNMSFHKSSQRSKDTPSGTRHVAKLQAIPGFVHFIDETTRLQKTQGERPLPSIITDKGSFNNQEQNNGKKPEIPMVNTVLQNKTEDASPVPKGSFNNGKKTETPMVNTVLQKNTEDAKPVPLVKNDMGSFNNGKKIETPIINTVSQKKIEDSMPVPSIKSEVQRTWSFSGNLQEDKKIEMAIPNKLPSAGVNKGKDGSWWGGSGLNGKFFDSGELNMKTQSFKSSPSVKLNDIKGQPNRSKSSSFGSKANVLEKGSDYLSCSSDEELDVNSAAAESAAALRKAIDQAQESIRLAKELMERKKDGFQGFSKPVSKGKGKKERRSDRDSSNVEENSVKEPYERFDDVFKDFKLRNMIPKVQSDEIAQRDTSFGSEKVEVEKHNVLDKQASDKESEVSVDKEKEIEQEFVFMNEESGINVERKEEESEEIFIKDIRNGVDELEGSEEKFQECLDIIDEEILVPPRLVELETLVEAEKEDESIQENVEVKDNEACLFVEEEVKVDEEIKERSDTVEEKDIDDLVMIHAQNKDQIQGILEEKIKDEEIEEKSCTFMEENQNVDVEVVEWVEDENKINEGTESLKIESNKSEEYEAEEANNSAFDTFSEETIIHEVQEQNRNENENEKTSEDHEETCYESEKEVEEMVKEASELDESEISETCQSFNEDQSCDGNVANEAADLQNDSNIDIQDTYEVHFCDEKVASSTSSEHRWQYEPSTIHLFHEKTASSGSSENNWLEEEIEEDLVQNFGKSREIVEEPEKEKVDDVIKEDDQKEAEKESIPVVSMESYEKIKNLHKEELISKNVSVEEKDMRESKRNEAKKMEENKRERIVVERAIREARERAFAETRERAFAEAREKAERAAVEKVSFEVRQRVMEQAREKHGKTTKIDKKPPIEAKLKAERAAVERATSEARERALEKALSQKSIADKLSKDNKVLKHSLSASDLEMEGTSTESVQRRKARLERHERIMERAAKALEEKNMRDLRAQKEQAERNRLAESLDADIKRWASGKEGNLRALLSTLQYILGQDSGWQAVSLTEIITTVAVKKAYRKATLYVHPDKLQQRGASIHQKYICEKVFDLLKAAWNRFNSEER